MPEAGKTDLVFDKFNSLIQVPISFDSVQVQTLINAIREFEDDLINMDIPKVADASGKDDVGGGDFVGITLRLINDWRVEFAARIGPTYISVNVFAGNLVATNSFADNPIAPSAFTQVQVRFSTAPGLLSSASGFTPQAARDAMLLAPTPPGTPAAGSIDEITILSRRILQNRSVTNPTTGKMQIYNDAGTAVLLEASLWEDADGTVPYRGKGAERRDKLV